MFAGVASMSEALSEFGMPAEAWDFLYGPQCDFQDSKVVDNFLKSLSGRQFILWIGLCCKTWSIARKDDGGPRPLRDETHLWGFDDLEGKDLERVLLSNSLTLMTLAVMERVLEL